jgi:hypothetical protein
MGSPQATLAVPSALCAPAPPHFHVRPRMHKLGHLDGGEWVAHSHAAVYQLPGAPDESQRVVAGVPGGDPEVFGRLVESLASPFHLLYVLHTPRGEGPAGRYQSPAIDGAEFRQFLAKFSGYLSGDARFDLWAHSPAENATVVWDRHNQVFAYGPLSRYELVLKGLGFAHGRVCVPSPHQHFYRAEFDSAAALVLEAFDWSHTPLREGDEQ